MRIITQKQKILIELQKIYENNKIHKAKYIQVR